MTDYKEYAKQMRENAVKNEQGNIVCSPELLEEISSVIERAIIPPCKVGDKVYVAFSTFYAEYKVSKFIYDGTFVWAKLVNEQYEPQDREILRCISFDINKTIFLDEKECKKCVKY